MIPVRRSPVPPEVQAALDKYTGELAAIATPKARKDRASALWENRTVRNAVYGPIKQVLGSMAHGIDACMYCGNHLSTTVDHFEPKSINPLRTFCWHNHLLACSKCNSIHKGEEFPRDVLHRPLLIDPTVEDPYEHLHLIIKTGQYAGKTVNGCETIDVLGLNERRLPEARVVARNSIVEHFRSWGEARRAGDSRRQANLESVLRNQPFADVCQAFLRQAAEDTAELVLAEYGDLLPVLRDSMLRERLVITVSSSGISPRYLRCCAARPCIKRQHLGR